jgi:hypothetical protein
MKLATRSISRRNFLLAVSAGGAAATAALVSQRGGESKPAREKKNTPSVGYHVTEHIRNYYRTTKV